MSKKNIGIKLLKHILYIIAVSLIGCAGIVFAVMYIDAFDGGFFYEYSSILTAVSVGLITTLTLVSIMFYELSKQFVYKLFFISVIILSAGIIVVYFLQTTGFLDKVDSVEDFRKYIASFNGWAVFIFILLQFLQVVALPIPAFVTVGAGVLLFGPFLGSIYSCIGIISGSIVAFLIGRILGKKVAIWLVGKEGLEKGLKTIKGKDKIILTFMFLFPFFPDDVLCFVAGISTISPIFFIIMIFVTRIISVFCSSYSMNNSIIPYDTWWGILIWIIFLSFTVVLTILIYKKGDKIESFFRNKFKIKKHKKKSNKN